MKLINADRFVAEAKFVRLRRCRDADVVMCCVSTKEEAGAWWLLKTVLQDGKLLAVSRVDGDTMEFYIIEDLFKLTFVDLSAHLSVFFPRKPHFNGVEAFDSFFYKFIINAFLYEHAGTSTANLPLIKEDAHLQAVHGLLPIAVLKENIGGFAAQLQCGGNQLVSRSGGNVLTRDALLETVWGYTFDGETRTVDVHIRKLRQKLGEAGTCIETVKGVGYKLGERDHV